MICMYCRMRLELSPLVRPDVSEIPCPWEWRILTHYTRSWSSVKTFLHSVTMKKSDFIENKYKTKYTISMKWSTMNYSLNYGVYFRIIRWNKDNMYSTSVLENMHVKLSGTLEFNSVIQSNKLFLWVNVSGKRKTPRLKISIYENSSAL